MFSLFSGITEIRYIFPHRQEFGMFPVDFE
jgi:hypothetical protein